MWRPVIMSPARSSRVTLLILGTIAVLLYSFTLPAFHDPFSDNSGWQCFLVCRHMLFESETDLFSRVYFPLLCFDSVAFVVLAAAMVWDRRVGQVRTYATYAITAHVLSWFILQTVIGDGGVAPLRIGYFAWAGAFFALAGITHSQRVGPDPVLQFLKPTFPLPLKPAIKRSLIATTIILLICMLVLVFWRRGWPEAVRVFTIGCSIVYATILVRR